MVATLSCLGHSKCEFEAIFNFGDSNLDVDGSWATFPAQSGLYVMTYFKRPVGRATDGRLIVDFLAEALGLPCISPYLKSIGPDYKHGANYATLAYTVLLPNASSLVTGIQVEEFHHSSDQQELTRLPSRDVIGKSLHLIHWPKLFHLQFGSHWCGWSEAISSSSGLTNCLYHQGMQLWTTITC
ncbi:GDSL esterase/lipase At4g01130-like isoform X2 [Malus domestica]|uniref:GDSL esterase/lipase At4g01130-like isoform X2 n=1 Tax=Malus domestica TaxID=3750 RepID=UPI0039766701